MPKNLPIGVDSFRELVNEDNNYLFVDKTLMIKSLIEDAAKVSLICRPRRWGKTLNLSMLQHFFSKTVNGESTTELFHSLKIESLDRGKYMSEQGKYPVIFVSFKDLKEPNFDSAIKNTRLLICELYREHEYLLNSNSISESEKEDIKKYLYKKSSKEELEVSLKFLSSLLKKHYGKQVYILIDEYDTPMTKAYLDGYEAEMGDFMKNLLSNGL
ncbi:MAG: AAA family ATPase, partial [Bacteroidia bacterium]